MDIIFDVGNVLFEWKPEELVEGVFSCDTEKQLALEHILLHNDWLELDKGTLHLNDAISRACERTEMDEAIIKTLFAAAPESLQLIEETAQLIAELHDKGRRLYILSNMSKYFYQYLKERYALWQQFSGIIISSHINYIKPDLQIFHYLIDAFNLDPENAVFIDDMGPNVKAAAQLGFRTILFDSSAQCRRQLVELNLL